jgi:hypothetical protein
MPWNATTYLEQVALKSLHYDVGPTDGLMGPKTSRAKSEWLADRSKLETPITPNLPPHDDYHSMVAYYGNPGDESKLGKIVFPYPMRLAWDKSIIVTNSRCHTRVIAPLLAVLTELLETYGIDWIKEHGLDLYGGIYNDRNTRGGSTKSKHSWGAAIDLNPSTNGNKTKWSADKIGHKGYANMPLEAIIIFERHGFKSGARAWGRDAMHFQFTK